ncbi:hypothetical protein G9A89_014278 [Geosiphon pyriformis]|nr:hypothetical protein G9A89_014278 [Geosiphon pyriformis]
MNTGVIFGFPLGSLNYDMEEEVEFFLFPLSISLEKRWIDPKITVVIKEIPMNTPKEMIVTVLAEFVHIAIAVRDCKTWASRDQFRALLFTLSVEMTAYDLGILLDGAVCCAVIEKNLESAYHIEPIFDGVKLFWTRIDLVYCEKLQVVLLASFFGGSHFTFGSGSGFPSPGTSTDKSNTLVAQDNFSINNHLVLLKCSLELLADQVSSILCRLNVVPPVVPASALSTSDTNIVLDVPQSPLPSSSSVAEEKVVDLSLSSSKTVNSSSFVVLGGNFNENRSGKSASFKFCLAENQSEHSETAANEKNELEISEEEPIDSENEKDEMTTYINAARMLRTIPYFLKETAGEWFENLAIPFNDWNAFKAAFLEQFTDNNTSITLCNCFRNIKQEPSESVCPHAPEDLNSAIQYAKRYKMAMEEANCTKLVNLAIGETSSAAEEKIDQLTKKLTIYQDLNTKITIISPSHSQSNSNTSNHLYNIIKYLLED